MFDSNDPRWTAYILNELDPAELAECETLLAADPDAGLAVAELRHTIDQLTSELQREPCPTLTTEQRAIVAAGVAPEDAVTVSPAAAQRPWLVRHAWKVATLAASLLFVASMVWHARQTPGEQPDAKAMSAEIAQLRADLIQAKSLSWRSTGSLGSEDTSVYINGNHSSPSPVNFVTSTAPGGSILTSGSLSPTYAPIPLTGSLSITNENYDLGGSHTINAKVITFSNSAISVAGGDSLNLVGGLDNSAGTFTAGANRSLPMWRNEVAGNNAEYTGSYANYGGSISSRSSSTSLGSLSAHDMNNTSRIGDWGVADHMNLAGGLDNFNVTLPKGGVYGVRYAALPSK